MLYCQTIEGNRLHTLAGDMGTTHTYVAIINNFLTAPLMEQQQLHAEFNQNYSELII